jgi:hypothetical protein
MGADELEEHQAYGDSTLGCNEATEQHKEQSGVRRNAARWRQNREFLNTNRHLLHSLLLSNKPPLHYLTTFILASAHLLSTFTHVHHELKLQ